jgi:hypothetical protein
MRIRFCVAVGLVAFLSPAAFPADGPLKIGVIATAGAVNRFLNTPEGRQNVLTTLKGLRISKFFIEGNRADDYVPVNLLREVRDDFASKGIETSGGIGPLPGEQFGVHSPLFHTRSLDFRAQKSQQDIADVFRSNAAVFDEMIVDDFYCFNEGTPEYRRDLLVRLIDSVMLKPARAVRPSFRIIIKLPMWYDRFHLFGYDPAGMTAVADTIWVGTESRNSDTRRFAASYGYVMPTEGYINYRWQTSVAGPKIGGAWFDSIDCTAQNYVDQAYQSVLAGARELTLFSLDSLMKAHPGQALLEAALPNLFELAEKVRGRPVNGISYYKPSGSDSDENYYLMDYLAMLGLPIVPVAKFPSGAPVIMLGSHASGERDLLATMKRELARGSTLILTPALLRRMDAQAATLAGVTVAPQVQLGVGDGGLEVDLSLAATTAEKRVSIPAQGRQVPVLTMRKAGGGKILVLNVRTFRKDDIGGTAQGFAEYWQWLMPPNRLGLPEIDQPLIDALRRDLLEPLKTSLVAPTKVAYYMLGDAKVLYNFRPEALEVKLDGNVIRLPANGLVWR